MVSVGNRIAFTNILGDFGIAASGNDSLKVTCFTYKPFHRLVTNTMETLRIELEPAR